MEPEHPVADPASGLAAGILCLRSGTDPADWFLDQVHALGAVEWAPKGEPDDEAWLAQAAAVVTEDLGGGPVHVIAAGTAVPRALLLAASRPELVVSVLAGDPVVDETDPAYWELLRRVHTPTLVMVAAPRPDSDTSHAQSVAGGIENGVMVIVDGTTAPVHRSNPRSFVEWISSFMSIAEGLQALAPQPREETHA
jgi:pimeloyl-ACP methyl ester carboxylesterase